MGSSTLALYLPGRFPRTFSSQKSESQLECDFLVK